MSCPLIGFIVKNSRGEFIATIGYLVESDLDDYTVNIVGHQPPQNTLEHAVEFIKQEDSLIGWYLTPVESMINRIYHLSTLGQNSKGNTDV